MGRDHLVLNSSSFFVGIGGGSAAGKTTLAKYVAGALGESAALIALDRYYKDGARLDHLTHGARNFDAPEAFDWTLLHTHLDALAAGRDIDAPLYDFTKHVRRGGTSVIAPRPVLIIEGIHALSDGALRDRLDLKVFLDTPPVLCFIRRLRRDIAERGRDVASVTAQYLEHVRPMYEAHIRPARVHADLVVSGQDCKAGAAQVLAAITARKSA